MPALPRLALGDIVNTTLCAWESPETDIVDAMNDMYVGVLPLDDVPGPAPPAPRPERGWAPDELERLRAWTSLSPPQVDVDALAETVTELDIPQVPNATEDQPQPTNLPAVPAAPYQLVLAAPRFVYPPPPRNNIPAPHTYPIVQPAMRIVQPTPFNFPPPPQPPAQLPKKVLTVAGSAKNTLIAHPSARRTSRKDKTLVAFDIAEELHRKSIKDDPSNTVCSFSNCRHRSPNPKAHHKHMMSHAEASFRCEWCGSLFKRVDTLNGHVARCESRLKAESEGNPQAEDQ